MNYYLQNDYSEVCLNLNLNTFCGIPFLKGSTVYSILNDLFKKK